MWRQIDTAPKDGTPILVFGGSQGRDDDKAEAEYMGVVRWYFDSWYVANYDSGYYGQWHGATHWMPLPSPPQP